MEYRAEYTEEDQIAFEAQHGKDYHREVLAMVKAEHDCTDEDTIMIIKYNNDGTKKMTRHLVKPQPQVVPYYGREED